MAKTQVFFLGGTGYAGGAILHHLLSSPSFPRDLVEVTALVRQANQASELKKHYPGIQTVVGTLDDTSLLRDEAAEADIVIQAADTDHAAANDALMEGLASRKLEKGIAKGTFILLSGGASLFDLGPSFKPGAIDEKVWSDVADMDDIWKLPEDRMHVAIERKMVADGVANGVQTVILSPPQIYSNGYGYGKRGSWYDLRIKAMVDLGSGFVVGRGRNRMSWISTEDLAEVTGLMVKDVVEGGGKVNFGKRGYYYVAAGEVGVGEIAELMTDELDKRGLLESSEIVRIDAAKAAELHAWGPMLWGINMRMRASRLKEELAWAPKVQDWKPMIRDVVQRVVENHQ